MHYVVIHKITKKEILIADPAKGIVKYILEDLFKIWTGVLILMAKSAEFKKFDEIVSRFNLKHYHIKNMENLME